MNEALEYALTDDSRCSVPSLICGCHEPCLLTLSWLGEVHLTKPTHVTSQILTCLGINREHHDAIINTVYNIEGHVRSCVYSMTGKFGMVRKLSPWVNIALFRVLLPYFPTTHVREVELRGWITDAHVNIVHDMLDEVICEELVVRRSNLTTTQLANMLVNVAVGDVVIGEYCEEIDIEEMKNLYPAVTFTKQPAP